MKAYGVNRVAQRAAEKQAADEFALLERRIVEAAEAWAYAMGRVGFAPAAQDLLDAVVAYRKARSGDTRR